MKYLLKIWVFLVGLSCSSALVADSLDGRSFEGMIGPKGKLDLADSLKFDNGHFWSDICTRCGFEPGVYSSKQVDSGIEFKGVLESDSRGVFSYVGLVRDDGRIDVSIEWKRERWYWTAEREIAFQGQETSGESPSLRAILTAMGKMDPNENPLCARF